MDRYEFLNQFKFRVVPCEAGTKKPIMKDWRAKATHEPGITGNYGVIAGGTPYGDGRIVVCDLDNHKEGKESGVDWWNRTIGEHDTFTVATPSGGLHLYFVADDGQMRGLEAFGSNANHFAEQAEIYYKDNHQMMGVGSRVNGREYQVVNDSEPMRLPDEVVRLYGERNRKKPRQKNPESPKESELSPYEKELMLSELERLSEEGEFDGYDDWILLLACLKNSGFSLEEARRVSWQDEKAQGSIEGKWDSLTREGNVATYRTIVYRWIPDWDDEKWQADKREDSVIKECLERYPHLHKIKVGRTTGILDLSGSDKTAIRDYKNVFPCYSSKENRVSYPSYSNQRKRMFWKDVNAFDVWWKNSKPLEGRKTVPNRKMGVVEVNGLPYFNDWEEPELQEGEGTPALFWEHLREDVCDGDERCFTFLQHWVWDMLANPLHRNNIAVAVSGNPGCGKSVVFQCLSMCLNPKYVGKIESTQDLMDRFDCGWKDSILVAIEEACFAGERKSGVWAKLKGLITQHTTTLERKGVDREEIESKLHFLITSNDTHIVPKEKGDRRYFVLRCNDNHKNDTAYFSRMLKDFKAGGAKRLLQEAMEHSKEALEFNFCDIPETDIGNENMRDTADIVLQWLLNTIDDYTPEEPDDYMPEVSDESCPIVELNDGIAVLTNRLRETMNEERIGITGFSAVNFGKRLAEYFGKPSQQIKYRGRNFKGYRFSSIEEMKDAIRKTQFNGKDVFSSATK